MQDTVDQGSVISYSVLKIGKRCFEVTKIYFFADILIGLLVLLLVLYLLALIKPYLLWISFGCKYNPHIFFVPCLFLFITFFFFTL